MTNTEATVLAAHGIAPADAAQTTLIDAARDHGVLLACLGCGTIIVAPEGYSTEDYHAAQPRARAVLTSGAWDCCPDAQAIVY